MNNLGEEVINEKELYLLRKTIISLKKRLKLLENKNEETISFIKNQGFYSKFVSEKFEKYKKDSMRTLNKMNEKQIKNETQTQLIEGVSINLPKQGIFSEVFFNKRKYFVNDLLDIKKRIGVQDNDSKTYYTWRVWYSKEEWERAVEEGNNLKIHVLHFHNSYGISEDVLLKIKNTCVSPDDFNILIYEFRPSLNKIRVLGVTLNHFLNSEIRWKDTSKGFVDWQKHVLLEEFFVLYESDAQLENMNGVKRIDNHKNSDGDK